MVSIGLTKGTDWDHGPSTTNVSFSTIFGIKKIPEACVILSIKITFVSTPIFSITNGMGFGVTGFSKAST